MTPLDIPTIEFILSIIILVVGFVMFFLLVNNEKNSNLKITAICLPIFIISFLIMVLSVFTDFDYKYELQQQDQKTLNDQKAYLNTATCQEKKDWLYNAINSNTVNGTYDSIQYARDLILTRCN